MQDDKIKMMAAPEDGPKSHSPCVQRELPCYMPWNRKELTGWSVVGMNHYHINGARYLFCAMTRDNVCITAEGGYENGVFDDLAKQAENI